MRGRKLTLPVKPQGSGPKSGAQGDAMEKGKLIYAMALVDKQIDQLDTVLNLSSMRSKQQTAHARLTIIQRDLKLAKKEMYASIGGHT